MNALKSELAIPIAATVLLGLAASAPLVAWGPNGHRTVAEIAQAHLNARAAAQVESILDGQSLAKISTWADEIRSDPAWNCAAPFHYVTVPTGASYPEGAGSGGDVVKAMVWYSRHLRESNRAPGGAESDPAQRLWKQRRREALGFLVHFVGDVHQPLHVGLGCDLGGNQVPVEWSGRPSQLHSVWDSGMIDFQKLSFSELARFVDRADDNARSEYRASSMLDWLTEAQELLPEVYRCYTSSRGDRCPCYESECDQGVSTFGGCPKPTTVAEIGSPPGAPKLGFQYLYYNWPRVEHQLQKAGLRLAALLDWLWAMPRSPSTCAPWSSFSTAIRNGALRSRCASGQASAQCWMVVLDGSA